MAIRQGERRIIQEAGPAAGRISGINHIVMLVDDMNEAVRFYRDVLGLRVVRTIRFRTNPESLGHEAHMTTGQAVDLETSGMFVEMEAKQVFFEMGNGELFSLYETDRPMPPPEMSISSTLWPPADAEVAPPIEPHKLDHLAFNVDTAEEIEWFCEHLKANGVTVSAVVERRGPDGVHRWLTSVYFYDPSGNPLEIATMALGQSGWENYDFSTWFLDDAPVEALVDKERDPETPALLPHFMQARKN